MSHAQHSAHDPKWRRLPEERPHQILDAALSVFAEHGIDAAKLEEIAARAGVSKGTIYLYFPSKEELFREVVRQKVGPAIANADIASLSEATAEGQLKVFIARQWECLGLEDSEGWIRLVMLELHKYPDLAEFHWNEVVTRSNTILANIIKRGIASGEFRQTDPLVAAQMIKAVVLMHVLWAGPRAPAPRQHRPAVEDILANITDFVVHALRAGPTRAVPVSGATRA